jgi:hypothetical protein
MVDVLPIEDLEARALAIVLAMDATDYQQGAYPAKWTEMRSLSPQMEAASIVHLRFHAAVDSSLSNGGHRGSPYGTEQMESVLVVAFTYHLVPATHAHDLRMSNKAAQAVAKAINRDESGDWSPRFTGIQTGVDRDKGLALKTVSFSVVHNIEV